MEFLNGSETIKIIRCLETMNKFKKYKIYSLTAFEDKENRDSISESHPDAIITKPCSKNNLLSIIKQSIE